MASIVICSLTHGVVKNCTREVIILLISFYVAINFIFLFIFYAELITLKYFFDFYSLCYLRDVGMSLSTVSILSILVVAALPYLAALIKFDFELLKNRNRSIGAYLLQFILCVTIVLALLRLNFIPYESIEVYTAAVVAKSILSLLIISFFASYIEVLTDK